MTRLYTNPFGPPWRFQWLKMIFTWQGGIFQFFWIEWAVAVAICAIILSCIYFLYDGKQLAELSDGVERLTEAVIFVARRFQAAIALMLGFYTIQNFNRWREVRDTEGVVMGTVNDLALRIAWTIRERPDESQEENNDENTVDSGSDNGGDEKKEEDSKVNNNKDSRTKQVVVHSHKSVRFQLIRWLNLSHAMVVGDIYEKQPNDFSSLKRIKDCGLATVLEYEKLSKTQAEKYNFLAPLMWFGDFLAEHQSLLGINDGIVNTLENGVVVIRRSLADLYRYRNIPIPLCYRQLTNVTVRMYMLILLLASVLFEKSNEDSLGIVTRGSFWIVLVFAFEYFMFVGWLTVADALGNPFATWADELDWENYVKALTRNSLLISSGFGDEDSSDDGTDALEHLTERWDGASLVCPPDPTTKQVKTCEDKRKFITGF